MTRYRWPCDFDGSEMPLEPGTTVDFFQAVLGIAHEQRFRGRLGDPTCTVLRHSMVCAVIASRLGYSPENILACLFHDLHEAFVSDMPSLVKKQLPGFVALEKEVENRVMAQLGRSTPDKELVAWVDQVALAVDILWARKRYGNPTPLAAYTIDPKAWDEARRLFPSLKGVE